MLPRILSFSISSLLAIFIAFVPSFAQERSYLNFGAAEGLPSIEVYQVIQDKKGFIWFGTDNGVVRFDGGRFEVFNLEQGLVDPVVFGLHEDDAGRIWFRSFTGKLAYFKDGVIYKYNYNHLISKFTKNAVISSLHYDSEGTLWLAILDQFIKVNSRGEITTHTVEESNLEIIEPAPGKLMFAHGVATNKVTKIKYNNRYFKLQHTGNFRSSENMYSVNWHNKKYITINNDIYELNSSECELVYSAPISTFVISMYVDRENNLWLGQLNKGLLRITSPDFKNVTAITDFAEKSITGILQDDESGYWITSLEKGVYYLPNFSITRNKLPSNSKITSVQAVDNKIITTDFTGIVTAFSPLTGNILWQKDLKYPIISSFVDKRQRIWLSGNDQSYIIHSDGSIIKNNLPSNIIDFTQKDDYIIGIANYGYFRFDSLGNRTMANKPLMQSRNVLAAGNELFMGGKNGLSVFDLNFNFKKELKDFADTKITNVTQLNDSILVLSTTGSGVILYNRENNNRVVYDRANRFMASNIYCVLIKDSLLWLATEKGIVVCSIPELLNGNPDFQFMTKYNGLVDDKVNFIAIIKNEMWAFGDEGYVRFPLSSIKYSNKNPKPYVKELTVNNKGVNYEAPLSLSADENNIRIRFGFISFNNQNIVTRFRLNQSHDEWTVSEDWTYAFNSLSAGRYKFELEYSTDYYTWNKSNTDVEFEINEPWWASVYFYIALAISIGLFGLNLYQRRVTRYKERDTYLSVINEQQKKLLTAEIEATERERNRIANDLHDGVSTDLISINLMLKRVSKKLDREEVDEIETQLNNTIAEIKSIIYDLTPPGLQFFGLSAGIQNYVSLIGKNSQIKINYEYIGEEVKDPNTGGMIFRVIQELITNSIKHSACTEIKIQITTVPELLSVRYTDNGIGFDMKLAKKGLGLSSMQSRVELLGGQINFREENPGIIYQIFIPLSNFKRI